MAEAYRMIRDLHRSLDDDVQREELDDFPGGPRWLQAAIEVWRMAEPTRADAGRRARRDLAGLVAEGIANTSALREFFARAVDAHADVVASY